MHTLRAKSSVLNMASKFTFLLSLALLGTFSDASFAEGQLPASVSHWKELPTTAINKGGLIERRKVLKGTSLDMKNLKVTSETIAAGAMAPAREKKNAREELMIIKEGELKVTVNGESLFMGPGSIAVTYAGDERSIKNVSKTPATYYLFSYNTKLKVNVARGKKAGGSFMVDWDDVAYNKSDIGGRRDIYNRSTAMLENFEMHVSTLNEGLTNHAAHTHRAEEFVLMIKGEVTMLLGTKTITAETGDLVYVESNISHSLNNIGKGETMYFAFQFWQ